ncbi:breast cancer anti-estrogen resistance protein 3 homolog isoform X1 [Daphnia pulicaria]|uniref:breast cancer anti-estrogen resistance protein 3 homolog isoform X1 n=2 Tax=Daphnia pulicaria TaxID=35523 RepID=UPI001EEC6203|nr:breast cancer anti-estrogen resistance protein 3 homolog isoform X1 [Daphnia pulicaria]
MHLDIKYWLNSLNLLQYQHLFEGYHGVQDILHLDESAIMNQIGIKNSAHRAKIVSSLVLLRAKHNLRLRKQENQPRISPAFSTSSVDDASMVKFRSRSEFAQSAHNRSLLQQHSASVLNISQMQDYDNISSAEVSEAESLRRQLEWELGLDGRCLESHAWYHGSIPRSHAESLLKNDGEFLIRDSSTGQPGDLVLSTYFGGHLHFMINKVIIQANTVYQSTQYKLEEEPFETISDLVTCYVGSGKAVTAATGAKITTPINRTKPLSLYSSRYSVDSRSCHPSSASSASQYGGSTNLYSGRNPLTPAVTGRVRMVHPTAREYSTQSLPRSTQSASNRVMMRRGPSDPSLSIQPGASPACPPKPSRVPSQIFPPDVDIPSGDLAAVAPPQPLNRISESAGQDVEDENNSEEVDVLPQLPQLPATLPRRRAAAGNLAKRPVSMTRNSFLDRRSCDFDAEAAFNQPHQLISDSSDQSNVNDEHPSPLGREFPTLFDVGNFRTLLLPNSENKPLDVTSLEGLSTVLESHSSKSIALHLLHADLDILGGLPEPALDHTLFHYQSHYSDRGITSGIELCALPNGDQLRLDLLERTHCLRLFVAVTILTCPTIEDRTAMLNLWIEVAIESKTALGNMYGFAGLMFGLCMPQIQRLTATWNALRQLHTSTAYTFETRLRPSHRAEVVPHAPNTTIPDLHSAILLWTVTMDSLMNDDEVALPLLNFHLSSTGPDFGLDLLASHMELIRSWSLNLPLYLRNSRKALEQVSTIDEFLTDVFRTEFHLKFLWGSRGVSAEREQRYVKFEQVLSVLSESREPS